MIKKLRRKFILIVMCSVVIVFGLLISVINVISYGKINAYSNTVMGILLENNGKIPSNFPMRPNNKHEFSPETPYELRFFTVFLDKSGNVVFSDTSKIAAMSEQDAESLAKSLYAKDEEKGTFQEYKFDSKQTEDGTMYVFLDRSREMIAFHTFFRASFVISAIGAGLLFVLIICISKIAIKPIEESYQKQKTFITNANHDIKTPITIISAETELIEMEHGESEWTKEIKNQVGRLTKLTDKLVFLSRMEEEVKPEMHAFNLSATFEEIVHPYIALAESKGLMLDVYTQGDIHYTGNEEMLAQAIALLMDNAVKYTAEKGKICARLHRIGKNIELHFSNDADNLKTGNLDEMFERFYRLEQSRNSSTGGNGIGMSVVKAIVTAHKGKVGAYSEDGTSIHITITL